jgi:hypothetical protein
VRWGDSDKTKRLTHFKGPCFLCYNIQTWKRKKCNVSARWVEAQGICLAYISVYTQCCCMMIDEIHEAWSCFSVVLWFANLLLLFRKWGFWRSMDCYKLLRHWIFFITMHILPTELYDPRLKYTTFCVYGCLFLLLNWYLVWPVMCPLHSCHLNSL